MHQFAQIAIGGRDHAHGNADGLLAAHAMKFAFLQHAQQFRLRGRVQVADFVQKQRASVGQFEFSAARRRGSGERAFFVAEQLALDQLRGNRRAVDFDERAGGERTFRVDVRGQQFLSRARFAVQQHARIAARGHGGLFQHSLERGACSDHARAAGHFAQPPVLFAQLGFFQRVLQRQQNFFAAERLFQKIEGAGARGFHGVGDGPVAGDHQDRRIHVVGFHPAHQVDPAAVRQAHVDQIGVGALRIAPWLRPTLEQRADGVAFALQNQAERAADIFFVVDDQIDCAMLLAPSLVRLGRSSDVRFASGARVARRFEVALEQLTRKSRAAQFAVQRLQIAAAQQRAAARDREAQTHAAFLERNGRLEQLDRACALKPGPES